MNIILRAQNDAKMVSKMEPKMEPQIQIIFRVLFAYYNYRKPSHEPISKCTWYYRYPNTRVKNDGTLEQQPHRNKRRPPTLRNMT